MCVCLCAHTHAHIHTNILQKRCLFLHTYTLYVGVYVCTYVHTPTYSMHGGIRTFSIIYVRTYIVYIIYVYPLVCMYVRIPVGILYLPLCIPEHVHMCTCAPLGLCTQHIRQGYTLMCTNVYIHTYTCT